MKSQLKIALAFVISLLWIQHSYCDEASDTSGLNKWKCKCSSFQGNQNYSLANCSKSCDCRSGGDKNESIWTCICDPNGFPQVAADGRSPNCFHSCNCTWGTVSTLLGSKKHISTKIAVVILLACVLCTTIAFLALVLYYVYRRDRFHIQSPIFSSDKETSSGISTANLISHRTATSSVPETKFSVNSPIFHITGCFQKASFLFGNQKETYHGNIIQFSFAELESATENFSASNLIGLGAVTSLSHHHHFLLLLQPRNLNTTAPSSSSRQPPPYHNEFLCFQQPPSPSSSVQRTPEPRAPPSRDTTATANRCSSREHDRHHRGLLFMTVKLSPPTVGKTAIGATTANFSLIYQRDPARWMS